MKKRVSLSFVVLSILSLLCCTGIVAYNWGYMQSAMDNRVAVFSAPANVSVFLGVPFIVAAIIFAAISVVLSRTKRA